MTERHRYAKNEMAEIVIMLVVHYKSIDHVNNLFEMDGCEYFIN